MPGLRSRISRVRQGRDRSALARSLGYDPVDVGPLRNAQHLESLAILWIHLATVGKRGREFAFKTLARGKAG